MHCMQPTRCVRDAQVIKKQLADGVSKRRVGFVSTGAPARQHSQVVTPDGVPVRGQYMSSFVEKQTL